MQVTMYHTELWLILLLAYKELYMTKGAEMEILTSTAIGSQLKRQSANDYLQELYRAKRHKNKSFDFQALLDKEMEKLNERQCKKD